MRKKLLSLAASCMNLQNHRRLPVSIYRVKIAALGSSERVTIEGFSKLLSNFKGASLKGPKHDQVEGEFFYIKQTRMVR
jgi:hypothetical protein